MPLISEHIRETSRNVLVYFVNPLLFWGVHTFMKLVIGQYSYFNVILKSIRWSRGLTAGKAHSAFRRDWPLYDLYPIRELICLRSIHILYSSPYSVYLNFLHSKIWAIQGTPRYVIFSSQLLANAFCVPCMSLCFMSVSLRRPRTKYGLFSRVHYEHNQHVSLLQIQLS